MTSTASVSPIIEETLADATLLLAWSRVHQRGGAAGSDGVKTEDFAKNAIDKLVELARSVREGRYVPSPILRVWMERPGKSPRGLGIPTVRDRILQTALSRVLTPLFEKHFEDCSYAYRPAHSLQMALSRIIEFRDQGYHWVVDADIQHFFDEIPHKNLLQKVESVTQDPASTRLLSSWIRCPVRDGDKVQIPDRGIPQGSPVSPLLANLYLGDLDQRLLAEGYRVIRFADDFIVLCKNRPEAERALHLSEDVLNVLSLKIQPEKTRITSFEQGFRFLGTDFIGDDCHSDTVNLDGIKPDHSVLSTGKNVPDEPGTDDALEIPERDPDGSEEELFETSSREPLRRTLYVIEQGAFLGIRNNRIVIRHEGREIRSIPVHHVDQIVLQGNQILSSALARECRITNADIFFSTIPGNCDLKLDDLSGRQIDLLSAQVDALEKPEKSLEAARSIVGAKISNSREILRQFNLRRQIPEVREVDQVLKGFRERTSRAENLDALRGLEGTASRRYFEAIAYLLPSPWKWEGRHRRPPTDPVNAVLSYGYGLLYQNILGAIRRAGLTPYIGIYHCQRPGNPALASDLIEEFRAMVVDRMMLTLFLEESLDQSQFTFEDGGFCCLEKSLRKKIVEQFEARMNRTFIHPSTRLKSDYRRAIDLQCDRYVRFFRGLDGSYEPFRMR